MSVWPAVAQMSYMGEEIIVLSEWDSPPTTQDPYSQKCDRVDISVNSITKTTYSRHQESTGGRSSDDEIRGWIRHTRYKRVLFFWTSCDYLCIRGNFKCFWKSKLVLMRGTYFWETAYSVKYISFFCYPFVSFLSFFCFVWKKTERASLFGAVRRTKKRTISVVIGWESSRELCISNENALRKYLCIWSRFLSLPVRPRCGERVTGIANVGRNM